MGKKELTRMFIADYAMGVRDAIMLAHRNIELRERMKREIVTFCFKKSDGATRVAVGTLKGEYLPAIKGTGRPTSSKLQLYFDMEKQSFRCFTKANLISVSN